MKVILKKPMAEYEQRQAVELLQKALLEAKKERHGQQPEMFEMEIYYLLSDLDMVPESYQADWDTILAR